MGRISEIALFITKFDTLDPLTEATSNDITMMKSWWNTSGMLRMSKISDIIRHTLRHQAMKKDQFLDISELFSNLILIVALKIPKLILCYHCNYCN